MCVYIAMLLFNTCMFVFLFSFVVVGKACTCFVPQIVSDYLQEIIHGKITAECVFC